jgi:hypothetical protein
MKLRTLSILALAAVAATGCKKGDNDSQTTTVDSTAVVPGTDSVQQTVAVPTTDTVTKTTTTTTEVDTTHGNAPDTMHHDTTKKM